MNGAGIGNRESGIGNREAGSGARARGSRPGARVSADSEVQGQGGGSTPSTPDSRFPTPESRPKTPVPPEVLRQVRLLELRTRGLVNSLFSGEYHSVFKGQGMEFAEVREYQPGDEVRSIDWNVTARMRHPFVKRYVEERELTVMLVVDLSGSSRFGTTARFKSELATELSAVLAMSASRNNDRVGALLFTDRVEHVVPPGKGRKHILRLIRDLMAYVPAGSTTNIGVATEYVGRMLNHRSIIFILSDFQSGDMERPIKLLAQRHDVVAVSVEDPRERTLPDMGLARFVDPETGEMVDVDTSDAQVRAAYEQAVEEDFERRRRLFNRLGIDEIAIRTDTGYVDPLLRFFRLREQRGRRG